MIRRQRTCTASGTGVAACRHKRTRLRDADPHNTSCSAWIVVTTSLVNKCHALRNNDCRGNRELEALPERPGSEFLALDPCVRRHTADHCSDRAAHCEPLDGSKDSDADLDQVVKELAEAEVLGCDVMR
jgi:hypothetical protein